MLLGALLAVLAAWAGTIFFPSPAERLGIGSEGVFFDLRGSLAAGEAAAEGLDPYTINPRDSYGRPHLYSSWWLVTGTLGLTQQDAGWLGPLLLAAFFGALVWIWTPRDAREAVVWLAALLSPAWLMAVYRTNNDLVVFVGLAVAGFALQRPATPARVGGAALVGALTVLKYFPAGTLLGVLGARRRREMLWLLGVATAVIIVGWPSVEPALQAAARYAPRSTGLTAFGATVMGKTLPDDLRWLFWMLALGGGALGFLLAALPRTPAGDALEQSKTYAAAATAAAVTLVSFGAGSSYSYKLIFLWPLLAWLVRDGAAILGARRARGWVALLLAGCWTDGLAIALFNVLVPSWSEDQSRLGFAALRGTSFCTQIVHWVLMGACLRLVQDWTKRQWLRLAQAPG